LGLLHQIATRPMDSLRFRDFARLKTGRDQYSRLRLPALREGQSAETNAAIDAEFEDDKLRAVCFRWILRGLPLDKAIRKVKTDQEISDNARGVVRHVPTEKVERLLAQLDEL
jgi:hypothetical protein